MFKEIRCVGFIAGEVIRAGLHILISRNSISIQEIKVDYSLPKRLRATNVPEFALFLYVGVFVLPTKILLKRLNYKHKIHMFIYTNIYSIKAAFLTATLHTRQSGLHSNTLYEEGKTHNVHQTSSSTVIASSYQVRNLKSTFCLLSENSSSAAPTIPSCWSQPYNFRLTQTIHPPLAAPPQTAKCSEGNALCQSTHTEVCRPGLPE